MIKIKQLKKNNEDFYPVVHIESVVFSDGSSLNDKNLVVEEDLQDFYNKSEADSKFLSTDNYNASIGQISDSVEGLSKRISTLERSTINETDPVFKSSAAFRITTGDIEKWNSNDGAITEISVNGAPVTITNGSAEITIPTSQVDDTAIAAMGYTKNEGTVTSISMNGRQVGNSGNIDLGTVLTEHQDITNKENSSNKVTSVSSNSTDDEYPSAKLFYDTIGNLSELTTESKTNLVSAINEAASTGSSSDSGFSGDYNDLINKPTNISEFVNDVNYVTTSALSDKVNSSDLSSVATSGNYNDLSNKPTIPTNVVTYSSQSLTAAQKTQARLNIGAGTSSFSGVYDDLSGKPTIPSKVSDLTNDSGYLTSSDLSGKQDTLVSGVNVKTINGNSILGSGNLPIATGSTITIDAALDATSENPVQNKVINTALSGKQDIVSDLNTIRSGASAGATAYQKPANGIPASDLSSSVQTSLGKADTAIQTETDPTVPAWAKTSNKPSYSLSELSDDSTHRVVTDADITAWNAKYSKPSSGIPASDLASNVLSPYATQTSIDAINELIPNNASSSNKLADVQFVNSSIASSTGSFQGTYNQISDLSLTVNSTQSQVSTALASTISNPANNDYCFVQVPTADATPATIESTDRYKYNGTSWVYEYTLNNSSFTSSQWNTINSGVTSGKISDYDSHIADTTIHVTAADKISWNAKSDFDGRYSSLTGAPAIPTAISDLSDDSTHRVVTDTEKSTWNAKSDFSGSYNDLTNRPAIPTSLSELSADSTHRLVTDTEKSTWNGKQDTISDLSTIRSGASAGASAYQKPVSGIPSTDLASSVQTSLGKADTAVQPEVGKGLFSGDYNDLTNKPTITDKVFYATYGSTTYNDIASAYAANKVIIVKDGNSPLYLYNLSSDYAYFAEIVGPNNDYVNRVRVSSSSNTWTSYDEGNNAPFKVEYGTTPFETIRSNWYYYNRPAYVVYGNEVFWLAQCSNYYAAFISFGYLGEGYTPFNYSLITVNYHDDWSYDNNLTMPLSTFVEDNDHKLVTAAEKQSWNSGIGLFSAGTGNNAVVQVAPAGYTNIASGNSAVATGYGTTASGYYSHAEGGGTLASSTWSHAEGHGTKAYGGSSHAEGEYTQAMGYFSHAEGERTVSHGAYAHAEGFCSMAQGDGSHAENCSASVGLGHSEGGTSYSNIVYINSITCTSLGNYKYRIEYTNENNYEVKPDKTKAIGINEYVYEVLESGSFYFIIQSYYSPTSYIANCDHIICFTSFAKGSHSHSEGESFAAGDNSHAEGSSKAIGDTSHSEGISSAKGMYSHAEGESFADAQSSHAEGESAAVGAMSHSEGGNWYGHEIHNIDNISVTSLGNNEYRVNYTNSQYNINAPDPKGILIGNHLFEVIASGTNYSIVKNDPTSYIQNCKQITFYPTVAFDNGSHAEGYWSVAHGEGAHAEGQSTTLAGSSHAEGISSTKGYASHAEGSSATIGDFSHAEGGYKYNLPISTISCTRVGNTNEYTITFTRSDDSNDYSYNQSVAVLIKNNIYKILGWNSNLSITITSDTTPDVSNCDSLIFYRTLAYGTSSHAEGISLAGYDYSHSEGYMTETRDANAHAEGAWTSASAWSSHAEGHTTVANGSCSHAEGYENTASGANSHAEGSYNLAYGSSSHAEGNNTNANSFASHTEGVGTYTSYNAGEHAQGNYNVSHYSGNFGNAGNTTHSIGIGPDNGHRKNAIEVMENGDVYVYGIGNYDGTTLNSASTLQSVVGSGGGGTITVDTALSNASTNPVQNRVVKAALDNKQNVIDSNNKLSYSLIDNVPTNLSQFTNDSGYVTNSGITNVSYDTTNHKIIKTDANGTTDVVTASTIVSDGGGLTSANITGKADKVSGATSGHVATLDNTGNLTDSGHNLSEYQPLLVSSGTPGITGNIKTINGNSILGNGDVTITAPGGTGKGITSVEDKYLATYQSMNVTTSTAGWQTSVPEITPNKRFLWNWKITRYSDGTYDEIAPYILGVYGSTGNTGPAGPTGATGTTGPSGIDGKSVSSITNYWLTTSASSNVTRSTSGWNTTTSITTSTNKYLWNYQQIDWSDNTTTYVEPHIVGIHGENGSNGSDGLNQATIVLYRRVSGTPAKPDTTVTYTFSGQNAGKLSTDPLNGWSTAFPAYNSNPCWVTKATVISSSTTCQITSSDWSSPVKFVENGHNGTDGDDGLSSVEIKSPQFVFNYPAYQDGQLINPTTINNKFTLFYGLDIVQNATWKLGTWKCKVEDWEYGSKYVYYVGIDNGLINTYSSQSYPGYNRLWIDENGNKYYSDNIQLHPEYEDPNNPSATVIEGVIAEDETIYCVLEDSQELISGLSINSSGLLSGIPNLTSDVMNIPIFAEGFVNINNTSTSVRTSRIITFVKVKYGQNGKGKILRGISDFSQNPTLPYQGFLDTDENHFYYDIVNVWDSYLGTRFTYACKVSEYNGLPASSYIPRTTSGWENVWVSISGDLTGNELSFYDNNGTFRSTIGPEGLVVYTSDNYLAGPGIWAMDGGALDMSGYGGLTFYDNDLKRSVVSLSSHGVNNTSNTERMIPYSSEYLSYNNDSRTAIKTLAQIYVENGATITVPQMHFTIYTGSGYTRECTYEIYLQPTGYTNVYSRDTGTFTSSGSESGSQLITNSFTYTSSGPDIWVDLKLKITYSSGYGTFRLTHDYSESVLISDNNCKTKIGSNGMFVYLAEGFYGTFLGGSNPSIELRGSNNNVGFGLRIASDGIKIDRGDGNGYVAL